MKVKVRNEQRRASGRERQKRPEDLSSWAIHWSSVHTWGWFAPELMCQAHFPSCQGCFQWSFYCIELKNYADLGR